MDIFHQVPGAESSDIPEGFPKVNNARSAGKGGIVVIFSALHDIIKNSIRIAERIPDGNFKILLGLDKGDLRNFEITDQSH